MFRTTNKMAKALFRQANMNSLFFFLSSSSECGQSSTSTARKIFPSVVLHICQTTEIVHSTFSSTCVNRNQFAVLFCWKRKCQSYSRLTNHWNHFEHNTTQRIVRLRQHFSLPILNNRCCCSIDSLLYSGTYEFIMHVRYLRGSFIAR